MIAGTFRFYAGSLPTWKLALKHLLPLCDRLYVLVHGDQLPPEIPSDTKLGFYQGRWDHGTQLNELVRLVSPDRPEWMLIPDTDEILPAVAFPEILKQADREGKDGISFSYAVPWEGFEQMIDPEIVPTGAHVKAVRFDPRLDFRDQGGFCVPVGYWERLLHCPYPLLHLYALTEEIRQARKAYGRPLEKFFAPEHRRLVPLPQEIRPKD